MNQIDDENNSSKSKEVARRERGDIKRNADDRNSGSEGESYLSNVILLSQDPTTLSNTPSNDKIYSTNSSPVNNRNDWLPSSTRRNSRNTENISTDQQTNVRKILLDNTEETVEEKKDVGKDIGEKLSTNNQSSPENPRKLLTQRHSRSRDDIYNGDKEGIKEENDSSAHVNSGVIGEDRGKEGSNDEESDDDPLSNVPPILPKRYILLLLLFLGFAVIYSLRVNINVAIVAMVNNRTRLTKSGKIIIQIAEFDWNSHTQALVVGSFYYGYWVMQVPGAWIAMKLGATRIFGYGVLLSSLLSLITPVATRYHVLALVGIRVAQGFFLGVTYPCVIAIWANWAPPLERSTMVTMTMAGSPVGNIIAIPVTGILAKYGFDGGWPSVFYFFGFLGLVWYFTWELAIYDKPELHPSISENERRYIAMSIGEKPFDPLTESLPWLAILSSIPMWGIIFGHFGACWGYYTLFTQMPTYLKDVQHLDIKTMGLVAATPYLFKALLGPLGGISADMLVKSKTLSIRGVRTLFYAIGCLLAGTFILMTGYYVRKGEAITFLILGIGFSGLNATGYAVNHLDLAPRYAGVLMGISNTFATIPGFLSPMVTGFLTKNKKASEWKIVFWITFIIYVIAVGLYTIMCSGEKQWWAEGYRSNDEEDETNESAENDERKNELRNEGQNKTDKGSLPKENFNEQNDVDMLNDDDNIKELSTPTDKRTRPVTQNQRDTM